MEDRNYRNSIFWPLIFLGVGSFMLLNSLGTYNFATVEMLLRLWPLLFIAGGIDNLYRGEGFVGATVMIGGGTLFLLGNLGHLETNALEQLLRYWPVLLIAFGLDLLIGKRQAKGKALGVLLSLIAIAALIWLTANLTSGGAAAINSREVAYPLQGAQTADIRLNAIAGNVDITPGAEGVVLAEGRINLANSEQLEEEISVANGRASLALRSEGLFYFIPFTGPTAQSGWDLRLSDQPVIDLASEMVFGEQRLDLAGLKVNRVDLKTVFGRNMITLPARQRLDGSSSVVFGETVLYIPRGAQVEINLDAAFTSVRLPSDLERSDQVIWSRNGNPALGNYHLRIDAPFGLVRIEMVD